MIMCSRIGIQIHTFPYPDPKPNCSPLDLKVNACLEPIPSTIIYIDFGVDSSSRFPSAVRTERQMHHAAAIDCVANNYCIP